MPRPRSHTPDQLAAAALAVIDRDGLPGLSMRAVATELGISPMALYRYVRDREELEALVVELVLSGVDTTPPPPGPWRERITALATRLRDAMCDHPAVLPLTLTHRHRSQSGLRWSETVLGVLTEAGIEAEDRVVALRAVIAYVIGATQLERLGPLAGPGTTAIAGLPAHEFPYMTATARDARSVTPDREFLGGLTLLLRGLA
ncbi:TetR/AcrR family transcriptional regulator [Streptomyces sp. ISL-43]|uniref:TetR/AcrR family transcriptional regulator n=1 Tax=Streptomyces sp. ISL-43 TaxID=2819183 RepID=UPI001BE8F383|nr:TetR/AcrR family transcriptional regulator [Streptomyces sp. ISL-43]MBT2448333.1 TetR/AcrR family transcriptional regulator [Streptomyces sp. ISL-43]